MKKLYPVPPVNCDNCKFINITEEQQRINKGIAHMCTKHGVRLFHKTNNPNIRHRYIYPCEQCNGKDFKKRK